jgi:hypothetical protein
MAENTPTEKDETPKAAEAPTVADPSNPGESAEEVIELDDELVQAVSGGILFPVFAK